MKSNLLFIPIAVLYFFTLSHKIDLTTSDLGRHLKNGGIVYTEIKKSPINFFKNPILNSNYYSYTNPDFATINHHWLGGLLFYFIYTIFSFNGLTVFMIVASLVTLYLFFNSAIKVSDGKYAFLATIFMLPLAAERTEIRPEIFTYLFCGIFINLLLTKRYWLLIFLQIIWGNMHIYFFMGPIIIGSFFISSIFTKSNQLKTLFIILSLDLLALFVTPFGVKEVLYPLTILQDYGYRIVENQSVAFLDNLGFVINSNLIFYKMATTLIVLSTAFAIYKSKRTNNLWLVLLTTATAIVAYFAIRNFTLFGLFTILLLSYNLRLIFDQKYFYAIATVLVFIGLLFTVPKIKGEQGVGLINKNLDSINFYKQNGLTGPIFNNYDIGGYLIYGLFPKEKVFVDNRPESYPSGFLKNTYIKMQEDDKTWNNEDTKWKFNSIFFGYKDATMWGQQFLKTRIEDSLWAPVYADNFAVILVKRNKENAEVIKKHELPKEIFVYR